MILCIGGTGSRKTNALLNFLSRKNNSFYDIIIFSGSSVDEPSYNLLQNKMPVEQVVQLTNLDILEVEKLIN